MSILRTKKVINVIVLLLVVLTIAGITMYNRHMSNDPILKVWSPRVPYSLDPLDYDALAHHICFRSVYSSLVSDYRLGEVQGSIAQTWTRNNSLDTWTFVIRKNLKFANGDSISSHQVALSFARAAYVMFKRESRSGLTEYLTGVESMKTASDLPAGISFSEESVVFKFTRPIPDLLEKISFGLYAIANSSDYDKITGDWLDKRSSNSSGPYVVSDWNDEGIKLRLRDDFPRELLLEHPIKNAHFTFDSKKISQSDLIVDFDDTLAVDSEFKFFGPVKSAIRYVFCETWQNRNSICFNKDFRIKLRKQFYDSLASQGYRATKSFFPLAIRDVQELHLPQVDDIPSNTSSKKVVVSKVSPGIKAPANKSKVTAQEAFDSAVASLATANNFEIESFNPPPNAPLSGTVDLRFRMTAILVDSPFHDIQFMFLSNHGIKLPDATGEIRKLISHDRFSVQKINELLWEQAIIWPIGHMALGIWTKSSSVSLKQYNTILPPLNLQWIEWE